MKGKSERIEAAGTVEERRKAFMFLRTASVVYWSEVLASERRCIVIPLSYELNLYIM
jgi:hypothetical protein